jgi:hypothetical protein
MPRKYFLSVALFGLAVIFGLLFYYIGHEIGRVFEGQYGFVGTVMRVTAPFVAIITTILMGMYFDKKVKTPHWSATIFLIPLTIYLTGIAAGSVANFLLYGLSPFDPMSYLAKPLIVGLYGTPGALGVGVISYLFFILISKTSARN